MDFLCSILQSFYSRLNVIENIKSKLFFSEDSDTISFYTFPKSRV